MAEFRLPLLGVKQGVLESATGVVRVPTEPALLQELLRREGSRRVVGLVPESSFARLLALEGLDFGDEDVSGALAIVRGLARVVSLRGTSFSLVLALPGVRFRVARLLRLQPIVEADVHLSPVSSHNPSSSESFADILAPLLAPGAPPGAGAGATAATSTESSSTSSSSLPSSTPAALTLQELQQRLSRLRAPRVRPGSAEAEVLGLLLWKFDRAGVSLAHDDSSTAASDGVTEGATRGVEDEREDEDEDEDKDDSGIDDEDDELGDEGDGKGQSVRTPPSVPVAASRRRSVRRDQLRAELCRRLARPVFAIHALQGARDDAARLRKQLRRACLPRRAARPIARDLQRLESLPDASPEYHVLVSYLECVAELPWQRLSSMPASSSQRRVSWSDGGATLRDRSERTESAAPSTSTSLSTSTPTESSGTAVAASLTRVTSSYGLSPSAAIARARAVLDRAHVGLLAQKRRVLEFLATRILTAHARGPILLFVAAPGTGKTSLARAVAESLGRPFVRIALGGVRDEAELRGHRRTYVGALPGRLIQALRRVRVRDPVVLLDEVDKVASGSAAHGSSRGDPTAVLLEVLDPEQNAHFTDAYLALPFDLSRVLFIATANTTSTIPAPLLDRFEVVRLPGYSVDEKVAIARRCIIPRQLRRHGLESSALTWSDASVSALVEGWTREAGVRQLEQQVGALCRHVALQRVERGDADSSMGESRAQTAAPGAASSSSSSPSSPAAAEEAPSSSMSPNGSVDSTTDRSDSPTTVGIPTAVPAMRLRSRPPILVDEELLRQVLGPPPHGRPALPARLRPGVCLGLAYASSGGEILTIEAAVIPFAVSQRSLRGAETDRRVASLDPHAPRGKLLLSGSIGDVMRESASAALSWVRSHWPWVLARFAPASADVEPSTKSSPDPSPDDDSVLEGDVHEETTASDAARSEPSAQLAFRGRATRPLSPPTGRTFVFLSSSTEERNDPLPSPVLPAAAPLWPLEGHDLHVHFPAGATPKDGPSAGIAIACALVSALLRRSCRADSAVTGEITLTGRVTAVGGVREKVTAARAAGLARVVVPRANVRDADRANETGTASRHPRVQVLPVSDAEEALVYLLDDPSNAGSRWEPERRDAGRVLHRGVRLLASDPWIASDDGAPAAPQPEDRAARDPSEEMGGDFRGLPVDGVDVELLSRARL